MADVVLPPRSGTIEASENRPSSYTLEEIMCQGRSELLAWVKEIGLLHAVDVPIDSVDLACSIVFRYYDAELKAFAEDSMEERFCLQVLLLLQKAILELYNDFEKDEEFARLEKEGYLLFRNLVELCEIRRESVEYARDYLTRIEKEHKILRDFWEGAVKSFLALADWKGSDQRTAILVNIWDHVCRILESQNRGHDIVDEIQGIQTLVNEYKRNIPAIVMQHLTVGPGVVAKVAGVDTGVPASWLLNLFKPPLDSLRERLARRVVGQDHVIDKITSVISRRHGCGSSPLASFLLLPSSTLGVHELGESLAEELFDSKDRFAWLDFSMLVDHSSLDNEEHRYKPDTLCRTVVGFLKTRPFCVLMFENIDKHKETAEFLNHMLTKGKLTDAEGKSCELSNTVIILTSSTGSDELNAPSCKRPDIDCRKMEAVIETEFSRSNDRDCDILTSHRMLLESAGCVSQSVDEVLVLNDVSPVDRDLIMRIWSREIIDSSWACRPFILYPSEAFVHCMVSCTGKATRRYAMRSWFKTRVIPRIYNFLGASADKSTTCHIDVLTGTRKLSCRSLELDAGLNSAWEAFQATLNRFKAACQTEKRAAELIHELRPVLDHLVSVSEGRDEKSDLFMGTLENLKDCLGWIISDAVNSDNCGFEHLFVLLYSMDGVVADLRKQDSS